MKKRRWIPVLLIGILALSACGSGETEETGIAEEVVSAEETEPAGEAETVSEEAGNAEETDAAPDETTPAEPAEEADDLKQSTTVFAEAEIEETELYSADGLTVTATGFIADAELGPEITVRVVNGSDQTVDVTVRDVSVNGFMLDPGLLYVVAAPGDTVDDAIMLYNFVLDARGIDTVATVTLTVAVMEDETYEEIGAGEPVTLTTSAAEGYEQEVDDSGDVIYEKDGIRVVCRGLFGEDPWDGDMVLYAENDSDLSIGIACTDVSVNGQPQAYANLWADLKAGTRAVTGMYLLDLDPENISGIEDVHEISFRLQIIDEDAWEEIDHTDEITLKF